MKQKRIPCGALPVLLALAALAVLAAGCLYLQLGWGGRRVALETLSGSEAALEGFSLRGSVQDGSAAVAFSLEGGRLQNSISFDPPQTGSRVAVTEVKWCLAPSQRDAANAAATAVAQGDGVEYLAEATAFYRMATLALPDGTSLRIRLDGQQSDTPLAIQAWVTGQNRLDVDYCLVENIWAWDQAFGSIPLELGGRWLVCWQGSVGPAPGLYLVAQSLADEELDALPKDGLAGETRVLCGTTAYGSLEPFYCPQGAVRALQSFSMGQGCRALVYLDEENLVWVDLIDDGGNRTDHRQVMRCDDPGSLNVSLATRQRETDAALLFSGEGLSAPHWQVLRAESGRFTVWAGWPGEATVGKTLAGVWGVFLNEAGDAAMVIRRADPQEIALRDGVQHREEQFPADCLVEICPLQSPGQATYCGLLQWGEARDWGRWLDYGRKGFDFARNMLNDVDLHVLDLPTIACDRGYFA